MLDHTTLSRRGRAFAGRQPRVRAGTGPAHLVLDSTGLEMFGQVEWCAAKHGRALECQVCRHYALGTLFGPAFPDRSKFPPSAVGTCTNATTAKAPATAIPPVTMKALVKLPVHCTK